VHHQTRSITASQCISKLTRLQPPRSHDHGIQVHLQTCSITASKCIFKLARLQPPTSHNHGRQVHLQPYSITASPEYILNDGQCMYRNPRLTVVDRVMGSIYSADPKVDRHHLNFHLILSYNQNTHSIFPNFWSHSLCPKCGFTQLCGSSTPGSIIPSHPISALLQPEPHFLNRHVQVLLQFCSTTIYSKIDRMYIYTETEIMHGIL
jgi:hypothetical protein